MESEIVYKVIRNGECVSTADTYDEAVNVVDDFADDWNNYQAPDCIWLDEPEDCNQYQGCDNADMISNMEWVKAHFVPGLWKIFGDGAPNLVYRKGSPLFSVDGIEYKVTCSISDNLKEKILSFLEDQLFFDIKVCLGDILDVNRNAILGSFTSDESDISVYVYFPSNGSFYVPFKWQGTISCLREVEQLDWRSFHLETVFKYGQNPLFSEVLSNTDAWRWLFRDSRVQKGMTILDLSASASVDPSDIVKVENGDKSVGFDIISRLACTLGIELEAKRENLEF